MKPNPLPLLAENDPYLKDAIEPLDLFQAYPEAIKTLAQRMHDTREAQKAIGLAANQVGLNVRMFVMGNEFSEFTCINPEVVEVSETEKTYSEGCLSFPRLVLDIPRPAEIKVRYYDVDFQLVECEFKGLLARCFLHELEHLNGVTFDTKVSKLRLKMAKKKREKSLGKK